MALESFVVDGLQPHVQEVAPVPRAAMSCADGLAEEVRRESVLDLVAPAPAAPRQHNSIKRQPEADCVGIN